MNMAQKVPMPSDAELVRMAKEALGITQADIIRADHRQALGVTKVSTPPVRPPKAARTPPHVTARKQETVAALSVTHKEAQKGIADASKDRYLKLSVQIAEAIDKGNLAEAMRLEALREMLPGVSLWDKF